MPPTPVVIPTYLVAMKAETYNWPHLQHRCRSWDSAEQQQTVALQRDTGTQKYLLRDTKGMWESSADV